MAHEAQHQAAPRHYRAFTWARILVLFLYAITIVAVVLLLIAFFLKLFGASTSAPFVQWVYKSSNRVLAPFRGIFPTVEGESGSVLDFSILFAILMYGLLALAIRALIEWLDTKLFALRQQARVEAVRASDPYAAGYPPTGTPPPEIPPGLGDGRKACGGCGTV